MIPVLLAGAVAGAVAAKKWPEQTRKTLEVLRTTGAEAAIMTIAMASLPKGQLKGLLAGFPRLRGKES
jgi:3-polyprenyl-4-hydroxybenzoate decarboxylase